MYALASSIDSFFPQPTAYENNLSIQTQLGIYFTLYIALKTGPYLYNIRKMRD